MIDGLVLAGGKSQRMGRPKPLLRFSESRMFLEQIVSVLQSSCVDRVTVVLGAYTELVQRTIELSGVRVVVNQDYQQGQLSSLIAGLKSLPPDSEAIVVCLVDNPFVTAEIVNRLIARFREAGSPIVIPVHEGKRGHPTLFGASLFGELMDAPLQEGARYVVRAHSESVMEVDVPDSVVRISIDTPQQYRLYFGLDPFGG